MKLPPIVAEELEKCGLPWRIDMGGRHVKLFVGNKLAGVMPRGATANRHDRVTLNVRAQIRRIVREQST